MTIETALEWIHSRLKFNIRPGLTRIEALLKLLGNPEKSYQCFMLLVQMAKAQLLLLPEVFWSSWT